MYSVSSNIYLMRCISGSSSNSSDNITLLANASGNADEYLVNFYGKDSHHLS